MKTIPMRGAASFLTGSAAAVAVLQPGVQYGGRMGLTNVNGGSGGVPVPGDSITLSANGQRVAVGVIGAPNMAPISVFDITPGREPVTAPLQILPEHTAAVRSLAHLDSYNHVLHRHL